MTRRVIAVVGPVAAAISIIIAGRGMDRWCGGVCVDGVGTPDGDGVL
jgi:hypothetical protein